MNNGIEKAILLAEIIEEHEAFELLSRQINIVNYRYIPQKYRDRGNDEAYSKKEIQELNNINERIQQQQFLNGKDLCFKNNN